MKVAIIGSGPIALEAALRFHSHGAAVSWFNLEDKLLSLQSSFWNSESHFSNLGLRLLNKKIETLSLNDWLAEYYRPLENMLKVEGQRIKSYEVVSITKRHLAHGEEIPGKTRFHDLFRVIYEIDPKDFIKEQKDQDPALYERLNQEVVNSLQTKIEMYEDVDLVIDCRRPSTPISLNINGRALGEKRIKAEQLHYGVEALEFSLGDKSSLREIAIVGCDDVFANIILNFSEWFDDPRMRMFLISHESRPLMSFLEKASTEVKNRINSFFAKADEDFRVATEEFMKKLRDWQQLDDFVQVKIPRPTEPIPRLVYFMAHNATAIDQLIDNKRVFLTLETSDFRTSQVQPENNLLELKTIGVDCVLVANGFKDLTTDLDDDEVGHYVVRQKSLLSQSSWDNELGELNAIEEQIFKLFSPADAH